MRPAAPRFCRSVWPIGEHAKASPPHWQCDEGTTQTPPRPPVDCRSIRIFHTEGRRVPRVTPRLRPTADLFGPKCVSDTHFTLNKSCSAPFARLSRILPRTNSRLARRPRICSVCSGTQRPTSPPTRLVRVLSARSVPDRAPQGWRSAVACEGREQLERHRLRVSHASPGRQALPSSSRATVTQCQMRISTGAPDRQLHT